MLVVGVVAADLGAAGTAEQGGLDAVSRAESICKGPDRMAGPVPGLIQAGLGAVQSVQGGKGRIILSAAQGL